MPFAQPHTGGIDRDLGQPGGKPGLAAKLIAMGKGAQESLLGHVFGVGFIAGNRQGGAVDGMFMPPRQFLKRIPVARLHPPEQFQIWIGRPYGLFHA